MSFSSKPHIFGKAKWPVTITLSLILAFSLDSFISKYYSQVDLRTQSAIIRFGIIFVLSLGVSIALTSEISLRAILSLIPSLVCAAILGVVVYFGFDAFLGSKLNQPGQKTWTIISTIVGLLISWSGFYNLLSRSSWIGKPCPSCKTRGKLSSGMSSKEYMGATYEKDSQSNLTRYNKYLITYQHDCSHCDYQWHTTSETKESH